jgi:guanylate kinase
MFNLPTLVTITAPTCAGKNYLLEEMVKAGFGRIVSTTDRAPRDGEVEGVQYFFISTEQSKAMEANGEFAELITYNGTRYGVTKTEMATKLADGMPPPIVILEPQGIEEYRKFCGANGYTMFSIYVETQESIRLARLAMRTTNEIVSSLWKANVTQGTLAGQGDAIHKAILTNNRRLKAIIEQERLWSHSNRWDVYADGTDSVKALEQIKQGVAYRNTRKDIYK